MNVNATQVLVHPKVLLLPILEKSRPPNAGFRHPVQPCRQNRKINPVESLKSAFSSLGTTPRYSLRKNPTASEKARPHTNNKNQIP
jgi:hypothetical protein